MWLSVQQEGVIALWDQFIKPLGPKEYNQFIKATKTPANDFAKRIIWYQLYIGLGLNLQDATYMCVSDRADVPGRNHLSSRQLKETLQNHFQGLVGFEDWQQQLAFFTNGMSGALPEEDENGVLRWVSPSQRIDGGHPHVFTFEFDEKSTDFFKTQLAWCRAGGKGRRADSAIGRLFDELSAYRDFQGITVNWSGHKSLHIHVVFNPWLAIEKFNLNRSKMRDGFVAHWWELGEVVRRVLAVPDGIEPDAQVSYPESFRRVPNGGRLIEAERIIRKPDGTETTKPFVHLLGIPAGTRVPQITLWEEFRARAAGDMLFFKPSPFLAVRAHGKGVGGRDIGRLTIDEVAHCEAELRKVYTSFPKLSHLAYASGHWVASFWNSPDDSNASSIMRDDFNHISIQGKKAAGFLPSLQLPLGAMMKLWLARYRKEKGLPVASGDPQSKPAPIVLNPVETIQERHLSPLERWFQERADDKEKVGKLTRQVILRLLGSASHLWIKGPEGGGKTSAAFAKHGDIIAAFNTSGSKLSLYAFISYVQAEKKAQEFNERFKPKGFKGIVLRSFDREYRKACSDIGVEPYSVEDDLNHGFNSLFALVMAKQTAVVERLKQRHADFWREIGTMIPVFFSVHQVMEGWNEKSLTRFYWHRDFWNGQTEKSTMRYQMRLCLAVYDEVDDKALLQTVCEPVYFWLDKLKRDCSAWRKRTSTPIERYEQFGEFVAKNGYASSDGCQHKVSFYEAARLTWAKHRWDFVTVSLSGEYARRSGVAQTGKDGDIYAACVGNVWGVQPRAWWKGLADKVIVLTTEVLPTAVAEKLGDFTIVELETPKIARDEAVIVTRRDMTAKNVGKAIEEWRTETKRPALRVISNCATSVPYTMTHDAAKGDNTFIGQDLAQTMLHKGPAEYEHYEVINAWAGLNCAAVLNQIDELNQTCGRNLGFRRRDATNHWVLLSNEMLLKVLPHLYRSRYELRLHVNTKDAERTRGKRAK